MTVAAAGLVVQVTPKVRLRLSTGGEQHASVPMALVRLPA